ncbi:unnamed protein product [Tetraodon nigroviridis]|uniref:TSC22 domain family protein 1 n=1 Tax=Tetraodon nigroviridis TaxID=99883 RepID=Q4RMX6_TETNG|nr:unnamed protein product [Tetraodon nigroviridis]
MHHPDFSGDPTGSRKAAFHFRRGSSGASASSSAGSGGVNSGDDNPTQAGSSSPLPHHPQPLSQVAGAQVKKKSGFQITSVTSAQINGGEIDTNSEPFRKGRWTCTEYYEKEVPHPTTAEAPKGGEAGDAESEAGTVAPAMQPPHSPYQPPGQDFTSPHAVQSPPQGLAQSAPLSFVSPQEVVGGPPLRNQGPPDFIQPTAPFQTQVQSLQPHLPAGPPGSPVPAPSAATQPLPNPRPAQAAFTGPPQSLPAQMPAHPLPAVLQPLLTPGALPHGAVAPSKSSQLEDAQKLLFQHQGLLGLPRLAGGEGTLEAVAAVGTLAHMGMSAEASAFMAAAAAGFRAQHEGGEDRLSKLWTSRFFRVSNQSCSAEANHRWKAVLGVKPELPVSGAPPAPALVAIDNKIEQAMDLVKSHLMFAVREEVEVLKEQIKELMERNSQLEQENNLLKNLASPEQMAQFQAQVQTGGSPTSAPAPPAGPAPPGAAQLLPSSQNQGPSA